MTDFTQFNLLFTCVSLSPKGKEIGGKVLQNFSGSNTRNKKKLIKYHYLLMNAKFV